MSSGSLVGFSKYRARAPQALGAEPTDRMLSGALEHDSVRTEDCGLEAVAGARRYQFAWWLGVDDLVKSLYSASHPAREGFINFFEGRIVNLKHIVTCTRLTEGRAAFVPGASMLPLGLGDAIPSSTCQWVVLPSDRNGIRLPGEGFA